METKTNVWKASLENGLIMSSVGIIYSLLIYFLNLMFNKFQGYLLFAILIALLFFMLRSFRDTHRGGQISYGKSFGAGMVLFVYYALIMAIFTFVLYKIIDPGLIDIQLSNSEQVLVETGLPQSSIDMAMEMQRVLFTPLFLSLGTILNNLLYGAVFSLVVSIFIKKEANPLLINETEESSI